MAQPSLAVLFGDEGRFELVFEPLQPQALTVELAARRLPQVCVSSFQEQQSGATVSSLHFGAGSGPKGVVLGVKLPPGPVGEVQLDKALEFELVARTSVGGRAWETVQPLRITPVGVPKLELWAGSWLVEVPQGGEAALVVEAVNEGTAPAHGVGLRWEVPGELEARAEPEEVAKVGVGERGRFSLFLRAKKTAFAGEYTVRLQPKAANKSFSPREAEAQLRVRVRASRGWFWPVASAILLLGAATWAIRALGKLRLD